MKFFFNISDFEYQKIKEKKEISEEFIEDKYILLLLGYLINKGKSVYLRLRTNNLKLLKINLYSAEKLDITEIDEEFNDSGDIIFSKNPEDFKNLKFLRLKKILLLPSLETFLSKENCKTEFFNSFNNDVDFYLTNNKRSSDFINFFGNVILGINICERIFSIPYNNNHYSFIKYRKNITSREDKFFKTFNEKFIHNNTIILCKMDFEKKSVLDYFFDELNQFFLKNQNVKFKLVVSNISKSEKFTIEEIYNLYKNKNISSFDITFDKLLKIDSQIHFFSNLEIYNKLFRKLYLLNDYFLHIQEETVLDWQNLNPIIYDYLEYLKPIIIDGFSPISHEKFSSGIISTAYHGNSLKKTLQWIEESGSSLQNLNTAEFNNKNKIIFDKAVDSMLDIIKKPLQDKISPKFSMINIHKEIFNSENISNSEY